LPAKYQQPRRRRAGAIVKAARFRNTRPTSGREKFDRIARRWDTVNKASELRDFGVCTSRGIKAKDLYLSHVLRKRMQCPELKRAVRDQRQAFEASLVLIEGKTFSTQLIQDGLHAVTNYQPRSARSCACTPDRDDRERFCTSLQRRRMARRIPSRVDGFPETRCNDHVDSTAQMLHWFKQASRERRDWMWQCIISLKPSRPLLPSPRGPNHYRS
jgi:phage terminase large subunit-like protein